LGSFTPEKETVPLERSGSESTVPDQEKVSPASVVPLKAYGLSGVGSGDRRERAG
jgi:hypothetical protein